MRVRARRFMSFWKAQGTAAVIGLLRVKLGDAIAGRRVFNPVREPDPFDVGGLVSSRDRATLSAVKAVISDRFQALRPLQTYSIPAATLRRITLITDSVGAGSLFGGVGTALIFAALLANRAGATLRILTRNEDAVPGNIANILRVYGIELAHEMQFVFAPARGDDVAVDVQPDEIFITTSWWTTAAALPAVPASSIIYLLQEDERMFYPFSEDRLHCENVLRNRHIRFVINTRLLHDHLVASGMEHLASQGAWFEPAFPPGVFHPRAREEGGKRRLFFYARPNNPRNLFYVGLAVLDRAVNEGVLDLAHWDVFLVGKDIPGVVLGDGYEPTRLEGLGWQEYADLAGTIDLGLSLMYTPHPSYPPLDLAASGAVVVTNSFGLKTDLSRYSRNILCADLDIAALVEALALGIALAEDDEQRKSNFKSNAVGTDWTQSFETVYLGLEAAR